MLWDRIKIKNNIEELSAPDLSILAITPEDFELHLHPHARSPDAGVLRNDGGATAVNGDCNEDRERRGYAEKSGEVCDG